MARPTLVSLARQTGVSRQTVSNVINAPERVAPHTRRRVLRAIQEAGYQPSAAGRALRNRRSLTLALRMYPSGDGINGTIMDRFVHSLVVAVEGHGYRLTLFTAASPADEVGTLRRLYDQDMIDGAVLTDTVTDDPRPALLTEAGIPFGAFGRPWGHTADGHPWVDIDGRAGTRGATEHLLRRGFRRVGFIGWPADSGVGEDRLSGWRETMHEQLREQAPDLLDELPGWLVRGEDEPALGASAMATLLDRGIDAVVCASDSLALGAVETLRQRDAIDTDAELPVIGFDDTPVARSVGLPSLSQPVEQAAEVLATRVIDAVDARFAVGDVIDPSPAREPAPTALLTPVLHQRTLTWFATTDPAAGGSPSIPKEHA